PWKEREGAVADAGKTIATGLVAPVSVPPVSASPLSARPPPSRRAPAQHGPDATLIAGTPPPVSVLANSPRVPGQPRGASAPGKPKCASHPNGAARRDDEERTHLLLQAVDLVEDAEAASPSSHPPLSAPDVLAADEARTRLRVGPLSVPAAAQTPLGRALAGLGRLVPPALRLSVWLDELLHERWLWALGAIGVICGFLAPSVDYLLSDGTATLGVIGWLCSCVLLALLAVSRLNGLRNDAGQWDPRVLLGRLKASFWLLIESLEHWDRSPRHLRLTLVGEGLLLMGLGGVVWGCGLSTLRLPVLGGLLTSLPFLSGGLLLGGIVVLVRALQATPVPAVFLQDFGNALAATAELPALVDLGEPLPEPFTRGTTALHETVLALARWRPRQWPDESAYRAALARHLERQLPSSKIERERWMGDSRLDGVVDLAINGMIVIGVKRGFDNATAERAIGQMSRLARTWSGKPLLLVVFDAPRDAIVQASMTPPFFDAREQFSLLTLRMPML
ncbi:MAG: hypothetical protein RL685_5752, partial [Pseudomonadota bacterium]